MVSKPQGRIWGRRESKKAACVKVGSTLPLPTETSENNWKKGRYL